MAALLQEVSRSRGRTRLKLKSRKEQVMEDRALRAEKLARKARIRRVQIAEENYVVAKGDKSEFLTEHDAAKVLLEPVQARERVVAARLGELCEATAAAAATAEEEVAAGLGSPCSSGNRGGGQKTKEGQEGGWSGGKCRTCTEEVPRRRRLFQCSNFSRWWSRSKSRSGTWKSRSRMYEEAEAVERGSAVGRHSAVRSHGR
eukprot:6183237-Pleurochrysis_carterae.AAC.4